MFKPRTWIIVVLLIVAMGAVAGNPAHAQQGEGYWYTVRPGDSWWSISAQTGIPVGVLQAHNPQAIRPNLWLWKGERLWIPAATAQTQKRGYWYVVQPGDTWLDLAIRTGVSVSVLKRLNPHAVHPNDWMWVGDRIFIPTGSGAPAPAAPATPTPPPTPTPTPQPTPTPTLAAKPTPVPPTPVPTTQPTRPPTPTVPTEAGVAPAPAAPTPPVDVACPQALNGVDATLRQVLRATGGDVAQTGAWLLACGLAEPDQPAALTADVNGDGLADVGIIARGEDAQTGERQDVVLVFLALGEDYAPTFRAPAQGQARLLAFRDVNADGRVDLVWRSDMCQGSTCYATVRVYSWQGPDAKFVPFTEGEISMPSADVWLQDVEPGDGEEIVLHGGIIQAIGAGPQRTWTEVWASRGGAPYQLISRTFDASDCLYHWVLDGNRALKEGRAEDAVNIFQAVVGDPDLQACWLRPNEEEELRSFGWFRLALSYAYAGKPDMVATVVNQAREAYPDAPYIQALQTWYDAYEAGSDPAQACSALADFVARTPILWQMLADYGYANPTFGPQDVCPSLEQVYPQVFATCPQTLEGAVEQASALLAERPGDILALYEQVRSCNYIGDDYGGVGGQDVDGDGDEDIFLTLDVRVGEATAPAGSRGVLVAFHREGDAYTLAWQKFFTGTVTLLALEDLNQDGLTDVAWMERVCPPGETTGCTVKAYVYSWSGDTYENWVYGQPAGRDARVFFEDRAPGSGQELILHEELPQPDSAAEVPARETVWASDAGAPYALYDVTYTGTRCARYALHSAEVAFLTGPRYGWERAIQRFQEILADTTLVGCSTALPAEEELRLLRDVARLRLAMAQVYAGDLTAAQETVAPLLSATEPGSVGPVARTWWETFAQAQDMGVACQAVVAYVQQNPQLLEAMTAYPVEGLLPATVEEMCPVLTTP